MNLGAILITLLLILQKDPSFSTTTRANILLLERNYASSTESVSTETSDCKSGTINSDWNPSMSNHRPIGNKYVNCNM